MPATENNIHDHGHSDPSRSAAEALRGANGIQHAAPVQAKGLDEEAIQKKAVAQKASPEEEKSVQMKAPEEEPVQGRFTVQKAGMPEEEPKQMKAFQPGTVQRAEAQAASENNTGMPDGLKSGLEQMSGFDLGSVKVNYNSSKPAQLNAHAYAQGTDIHIAPGQEQQLPHEGWHVVQQMQGRVQPTMQMKESVPVNDDPGLEHEADVMGAKALSAGS